MARKRPFRFGLMVRGGNTAREWTDLARRAESLGYSVLLMPDHFGDQMAPLPALAAAATATTSLRLGTLVIGNDFRNPAVLAKEVATLDVVSDGRFELGLGTGWASEGRGVGRLYGRRDRLRDAADCFFIARSAVRIGHREEGLRILIASIDSEHALGNRSHLVPLASVNCFGGLGE